MQKLLVILGPTAVGKTGLGLNLAKKLDGELIACDSRQVYQGLDVGTGKVPDQYDHLKKSKGYWQINGIKIWLYDVTYPTKQYNVAQYTKDAKKVMADIIKRGKLPIVVGGTGLYLKALVNGLSNLQIPVNKSLRRKLEQLPLKKLQEKLANLSPAKWQDLNNSEKNNSRRLIRHIELFNMSPDINKSLEKLPSRNYNILIVGLTAPRPYLNQSIDDRVLIWLDQGIIKEVKSLISQGVSLKKLRQLGLEYAVLADYLIGHIKKEDLKSLMQTKIHQYAKRQLTWFKREKSVFWFDVSKANWQSKVVKIASDWYNT